ncbi:hypothetical protein A3G63_02445 [Candidatus Kaiserbacteria bacterium RIFCSPLOWO2_12_FULL_52_8]|uniref:Methyltransferase type 11 domain-containing protein n=1 Tax=Candidatus Kaiserbacteria bacterium RIFCSPHIGHO2_01_FULL_53_31 TaxID=1798481 RepID=A0A1F6CGA9_9BACT|nr:MAG: hypothetical protein A2678_01565 [Candidatus Kaiserbacteria bacterium RIFCSPHIGHO2_01_FULL_53_31]OGG92760.1 MAG: hypothetical protein A3G63_02445 [Candidatus Kaiserbacteria bacterium RIFCSPLOWO2_12_FULL_52_8]
MLSESQHNTEIENNRVAWGKKPLLQQLYRDFYEKMFAFVRTDISGNVVELGSGLGAFKAVYPNVITTDLFANPGIDRVENAYHLSFKQGEASNLILFDVFHHLRYPGQALEEFARVLPRDGRVIMFEPYISVLGALVYGLFHHESVALKQKISWFPPRDASMDNSYYAAQGNATRIFSVSSLYKEDVQKNWRLIKKEKCSALSYVLSGGFSKPCLYPLSLLPVIRGVERALDCLPLLFATRVLIVLERK